MITFRKLGKKGNLGNQLFQIASTIGIAKRYDQDFGFGNWEYQSFFKKPLPKINFAEFEFQHAPEQEYQYHNWNLIEGIDYDLEGWLQTEKYFDKYIKQYFEFVPLVTQRVDSIYLNAFEKSTILISIRRGDFVRHKDYYQTPIKYFLNALYSYFDNWLNQNLIILSDDIEYCKYHFSFLPNVFFGEGLSAIEQLYLGTKCQHFIISNSTFSWWSAWLGEKENSIVIAPIKNFRGNKSLEYNDADYYPERWIKYDFQTDKIKLNKFSVEFDRMDNLQLGLYKHYFEYDSVTTENRLFLKPNFIISPILIFYCSLLQSSANILADKIIKVSHKFDKNDFLQEYDFGYFSAIIKKNRSCEDLEIGQLKSNLNKADKLVTLKPIAGKFISFGGFSFRLFLLKKNTVRTIKSNIKAILRWLNYRI